MQTPWPLRSLLFVPAHRIDWVRKIGRTPADAVILDLEDAVAPDLKPKARELIAEEISLLREHGIVPIVRVNAIGCGAEEDLEAIVQPGLAGVMLPKADQPGDVATLDAWLALAEHSRGMPRGGIGIIPLPETARGLWLAHEIAAASPRVSGLITAVSGPVVGDVARAFGFLPSEQGDEQLFLQSRIILASRAAGARYPIGTLQGTRLDDLDAVRRLAHRARRLGFSGAALIHPSHVPIANEVFRPSAQEVAYARGLVDAMAAAQAQGQGAAAYQGVMVDAAMLPFAHELIAADARFTQRDLARRESASGAA